MEILDTTGACFVVDEDLLNFTLDDGCGGEGEEEEVDPTVLKGGASASSSSSLESSNPAAAVFGRGTLTGSFHPEFMEEELEWLSNKDAFPSVETCFGILSDNPELISDRHSPVSVLDNITITTSNSNSNSSGSMASCCNSLRVPTNYPVRARSKRKRRTKAGSVGDSQCFWVNYVDKRMRESSSPPAPVVVRSNGGAGMGRRCLHCQADKTPQWRAGPMGPKTLCNACGVRYKSGRLLPEYRPANSPTFSSVLHSNSHRKVVEMRRKKQVGETCGYRV